MTPETDTVQVEELVSKYVQMRDVKAQLKKQFVEKTAPLEEAIAKIEALLLQTFSTMGMESVRTAAGTAYKSTRCSATVADWESVLPFIIKHNLWSMLEKRVSKDAVEAYRDENGDLPPGVNWREEITVNVRRT